MADPKASGSISSERAHPDHVKEEDADKQRENLPGPDADAKGSPDDARLRSETAHRKDDERS